MLCSRWQRKRSTSRETGFTWARLQQPIGCVLMICLCFWFVALVWWLSIGCRRCYHNRFSQWRWWHGCDIFCLPKWRYSRLSSVFRCTIKPNLTTYVLVTVGRCERQSNVFQTIFPCFLLLRHLCWRRCHGKWIHWDTFGDYLCNYGIVLYECKSKIYWMRGSVRACTREVYLPLKCYLYDFVPMWWSLLMA